ncbi:MAG: AAA family ATPase [Polyangiales bacterium]
MTLLFSDLRGYTQWNEEEDPEDIAQVMDAIRREAVNIVEAHGGIVNQFIGDEIMGVFGVVSSHEDDAARAVAAARALHAYVRGDHVSASRALRLHSGAETGLVYARENDLRSGLFEITGDALNTAARLRSLADDDELLVGPETARRIAPFFELQALPPVRLHGKASPIVPQRVLAATRSETFFDAAAARGLSRYIERPHEHAVLWEAWQQALAGEARLVSVAGPPGIGKTRLLHEFRAWVARTSAAETPLILHARCSAYGSVPPFHPFIEALSPLVDQNMAWAEQLGLSPAAASTLAQLFAPAAHGSAVPAHSEAAALRQAIVAALGEILIALARRQPVLLVMEDWHCADDTSRTALRQIADAITHTRVLIVLNFRSTESEPITYAHRQVELSPLDSALTDAMASAVLGGARLPSQLSELIHGHTLGNPFFVEEICRALLERGACILQGDAVVLLEPLFAFSAPNTVQALVRARIDRLPAPERELLRLAAAIGHQFSLELIEAVAAAPPARTSPSSPPLRAAAAEVPPVPDDRAHLLRLLASLVDQGLIYRVDSSLPPFYSFKHAITQEVAYEGLPLSQRRRYHGELARLLEARLPPEQRESQCEILAHHYGASGDTDRAILYATMAGDKAWRSFSIEQAERQYRRAIEALQRAQPSAETQRRYIDVSLSWARVGVYNPREEQIAALRDSLNFAEGLGDVRRACLCLNWRSWIEYGRGDQRAAYAGSLRFLDAARALGEERLIAQAKLNLGLSHFLATEYTAALAAYEEGLRMLARLDGAAFGYARGYVALIQGDQGDFAGARESLAQVGAAIAAGGKLSLEGPWLMQCAMIDVFQGAWESGLGYAQRAHAVAERIEGMYLRGMSLALEGYTRFAARGDTRGLDVLRDASGLLEAHGVQLHISWLKGLLAEALAVLGRYDEAQTHAKHVLRCVQDNERLGEVTALRALVLIAGLRDRELTRALEYAELALQAADAKGSPREVALTQVCWARVLTSHGELARAAELQTRADEQLAELQIHVLGTPARS